MEFYDEESGLHSFSFFQEWIKLDLIKSKRTFHPVTVISLLFDNIEKTTAQSIKENLREGDIVSIHEKYIYAYLSGTRNPDAVAVAYRLRKLCNDQCVIGVATTHVPFLTPQELLDHANNAINNAVDGIGKVQIGNQRVNSED